MSLPPITEDDKPSLESMIQQLVRLRRRYAAHSKYNSQELDDAIKSLHEFGAMKGR